jgi:predicted O-methyltransferase YrrM
MLKQSDSCVEYGSGRSTIWFAKRVGQLTSVEHDKQWHSAVSGRLASQGLTNVNYILAPRDQPDEQGGESAYTRTACEFTDDSLDFALVDGIYRDHVTKVILPKIKTGGILAIDNSNWYLPTRSHAPSSRRPELGPDGPVWQEVARELAEWRPIWTTSGVTDTTLFLKPGS